MTNPATTQTPDSFMTHEREILFVPRARKPKQPRDWACQECGHRMTLKAAERASFGPDGCRKCGGADIDMVQP